jgi:hypothetical protein
MQNLNILLRLFGEGGFGGFLLGVLFGRAGALAAELVADEDADGEGFVVIGAGFFDYLVLWREAFLALDDFLQVRFRVHPGTGFEDFLEGAEQAVGNEFLSGVVALVEIDGTDDSFVAVGQDLGPGALGSPLLATAEAQQRFEFIAAGGGTDAFGTDEG